MLNNESCKENNSWKLGCNAHTTTHWTIIIITVDFDHLVQKKHTHTHTHTPHTHTPHTHTHHTHLNRIALSTCCYSSLQDQYDKISSHTEQGIEFTKKVASFVEKRIHVEHSYAKDLRCVCVCIGGLCFCKQSVIVSIVQGVLVYVVLVVCC